jgi:hypothetical protein
MYILDKDISTIKKLRQNPMKEINTIQTPRYIRALPGLPNNNIK